MEAVQWRVMCSKPPTLQIRQAATFWILYSLCSWLLGNPYSKLLQKSKGLVTKAFTRIFVHSKLRNFLILLMLYKGKNAVLPMLFIWVSNLSCPSNQQPRFLTLLVGAMLLSPTCMESMLTLASCCLVPMIMNSVIMNSFNDNEFSSRIGIEGYIQSACHRRRCAHRVGDVRWS